MLASAFTPGAGKAGATRGPALGSEVSGREKRADLARSREDCGRRDRHEVRVPAAARPAVPARGPRPPLRVLRGVLATGRQSPHLRRGLCSSPGPAAGPAQLERPRARTDPPGTTDAAARPGKRPAAE